MADAAHTPAEREAIYDAEIAPALKALSKRCAEVGMCFLAFVEWAPGEGGRTMCTTPEMGVGAKTVYSAMAAHGNADSLIIAMARYAREYGHNSICLHQLGVPTTPSAVATPTDTKDGGGAHG